MRLPKLLHGFMISVIVSAIWGPGLSSAQDLKSVFDQCRGSKDLLIKAQSCSVVLQKSRDRSQIERAYNSRGLANMGLMNFANAVQDFTKAIQLDPRNSGYVDNRQGAYFALGRFDLALTDANIAIRLSPKEAFVYHSRGLIYSAIERYEDAANDISSAISLDSKWIELFVDRGTIRAKTGQYESAISDFSRAIELKSDLVWAFRERGLTYKRMGRREDARSDLAITLRSQPDDYEVIAALKDLEVSTANTAAVTAPGRRVALVIGQSDYRYAPKLDNPTNDAADISTLLRKLNFEVVESKNLDRRGFDDAIREFGRKLDRADIALFFYAGHGLQVGGKNYLVPVDAKLERLGDLALDAVELNTVMAQMEAEKRVNLVFLDACRDNPLARSLARSLGTRSVAIGQGLASIQGAVGTLIAYSTQPDNVALDGEGRNSPFTMALLRHLATPGMEIGAVMRRVRADVIAATRDKQIPWDSSSLVGDVLLAR
jgi:tetratricopeptide (TPR) repeat protein